MDIKDNKPLQLYVILAALIIIGGGVGFWLTKKSASEAESQARQQVAAAQQVANPPAGTPAPNQDNVDELRTQTESEFASLVALQDELKPFTFSPDGSDYPADALIGDVEEKSVSAESFLPFVQAVYEQRRDRLEDVGAQIEDGFFVGMEKYRAARPQSDKQARFLSYELGAIDAVLEVLTENEVKSVSITRTPSGPELASGTTESAEGLTTVADYHPVQIQFTGRQQALQEIVNYLSNTRDYFFQLRMLTVRNEKISAPTVKEVEEMINALKPAGGTGGFGGFGGNSAGNGFGGGFGSGFGSSADTEDSADKSVEGADDEEAAAEDTDSGFGSEGSAIPEPMDGLSSFSSSSREIAVQVLGAESITVTLDLVLVTFRPLQPENETSDGSSAGMDEDA